MRCVVIIRGLFLCFRGAFEDRRLSGCYFCLNLLETYLYLMILLNKDYDVIQS